MTTPDLSTPEAIAQARAQAAALLAGITQGTWDRVGEDICAGYEYKDGKHSAEWIAELSDPSDFGDTLDDGWQTYSPTNDANARLILAAPTTARTLVTALDALAAADAERQRLRRDVLEFIRLSTPNGGYDYWAAVRQRLLHVLDPEEGD